MGRCLHSRAGARLLLQDWRVTAPAPHVEPQTPGEPPRASGRSSSLTQGPEPICQLWPLHLQQGSIRNRACLLVGAEALPAGLLLKMWSEHKICGPCCRLAAVQALEWWVITVPATRVRGVAPRLHRTECPRGGYRKGRFMLLP